ncbi:NTP transferase domain-containing protein [Agrobacterium pusense]|uniref:NTP transferase domain-containing protein n=1 Tax=Agrobacterium pusense TaxID=648995 RepID=UPI003FD68B12|nr:NTP transferase domain-containing protein [Agrobacterium sp. S2]
MSTTVTVVISCAGMGRRLGLSRTKALAQVCGRPLIHWQLDSISAIENVRIVVGYQAEEVIACVRQVRSDVVFAFNRDFQNTGTAASFVAGSAGAKGRVVSLDGDLLISPQEFARFIAIDGPALGVLKPSSEEPLYALLNRDTNRVEAFSREKSTKCLEWSGLCQLDHIQIAESVAAGRGLGHVYELVEQHLPLPAVNVDAREIDTPEDFAIAERWLKERQAEWHGING